VWQSFEATLGLGLIPEPMRSLVLQSHQVNQETVVGYWQTVLRTDPDALQMLIDAQLRQLQVPVLGVFGRPTTPSERERFGWLPDAQVEEWAGDGHFVQLVEPDRFATRLREFVDHCTPTA
jgi:pimeloyl-ACP methyl ester carboxylesterase